MSGIDNSHNGYESKGELPGHFAQSILRAIEKKYGALITAARKDWERRFAGCDRTDSCVSVRISACSSPEERSLMFPLELHPDAKRFVAN
jgi:hypothetical protein